MVSLSDCLLVTKENLAECIREAAELAAKRAVELERQSPAKTTEFVSLAQASSFLGVSKDTLRRRLRDGKISFACAKPLRFNLDDIRREMANL